MSEEITLTEEQQRFILDLWNSRPKNPPSIPEIVNLIFGIQTDGRCPYAKAVKGFLATRKVVSKTSTTIPKPSIQLTDEQKEYIHTNCASLSALEMAKALFKNEKLTNASAEVKVIAAYLQTLPKQAFFADPKEVIQSKYNPPNTLDRVVARINKYLHNMNLNYRELTPKQKKDCESLIGYMFDPRFLHQINTYLTETERNLFESSFVKYTYDKPDLTREDIDQYIMLCIEVVMSSNIQKVINNLQDEQDSRLSSGERMSMELVEAINTARNEYNSSVTRQQKLFKALTEERSARLESQIKDNATILNIVHEWKQEETRKRMLHWANVRKAKLKEGIEEIESMEEWKARIFGIGANELLEG